MNIRRLLCFFSARSCSTSSSEICGTRGKASRKRLRLGVKPLISLILIIGILFSFSVSSYAAETITYCLHDFTFLSGTKPNSFELNPQNGKNYTLISLNTTSSSSAGGGAKYCVVSKVSDQLKIGASYTLTYSARALNDYNYKFSFYLTDEPNNLTTDSAVPFAVLDNPGTTFKDYNIQFQFPDKFNGKQVYLVFEVIGDYHAGGFLVSDFVFTNNDNSDDKIDGILEWLSALYHSIVGGEDSRGVKHDGLVKGIKNGLVSLGNTIGGFFENLKTSIEVKIDGIKQWFVELGENIIDGIKSLFIPEDGYFESKKAELEDFFAEHFGIVYTAGSLSIDVLKKFTSLKPPAQSVLHVPAWQIQLPFESDKIITIVPAMDVNFSEYINASGVLHTLYSFYRAFITVVIIFMVVNYAKRKFDYVFGKDGEGVE